MAAIAILAASMTLAAQEPTSALTTVSLRRNVSDSSNRSIEMRPGGRLIVTNNTVRNMLRNIERLQEFQLVGGPDWIATDRWDIQAVVDAGVTEIQAAALLKAFLVERFKLKLHTEQRDTPIYALVVLRPDRTLGPELRSSTIDCPTSKGQCGDSSGPGFIRVVGRPLDGILRTFERASGRMVVNRTALTGAYDFHLRWRPFDAPEVNPDLPALFTAIEEQLGLRLQADRAPVDVLVIDSAERPLED